MKNPTAGKAKWAHLAIAMKALAHYEADVAVAEHFRSCPICSSDADTGPCEEGDELVGHNNATLNDLYKIVEKHREYLPPYPEHHKG